MIERPGLIGVAVPPRDLEELKGREFFKGFLTGLASVAFWALLVWTVTRF